MLSLFSKVSSLWGNFNIFNDSSKTEVSDSDTDDEEPTEQLQSQEFHGVVTNLNASERFGFVNGDIYFSYDVVTENKLPIVGDNVVVTAKRVRDSYPWKAVLLTFIEEFWDEVDTKKPNEKRVVNPKSTTGLVVAIDNDVILLEDGTKIILKNIKHVDFIPFVGDVILYLLEDSKFQPSRTWEFNGEITNCNPNGSGTIDHRVWFNSNACLNGFRPRRGTSVVVLAIESHQQNFLWRAIKIVPRELHRAVVNNTILVNQKSPVQKNFLSTLLSDKEGITITSLLDFGVMVQNTKGYITVHIQNCSKNMHTLKGCRFQRKDTQFTLGPVESLQNIIASENAEYIFLPNSTAYVNIFCTASELGRCRELLLFELKDFEIGRHISVQVKHPLQEMSANSNSYKRRTPITNANCVGNNLQDEWILPGEKPFRSRHYLPVNLPLFAVPEKMKSTVLDQGDIISIAPALAQELTSENYSARFSALLHLEEIQLQLDMRRYDMSDVCLTPMGVEYLSLVVPGLAEGRPSLLIGDKVYLRAPNEARGPVYQGYIHEVLMEHILIKFHSSFHSKNCGESYDVSFQVSRTGMRRCHHAAQQVTALVPLEVLFPTDSQVKPPIYQSKAKTVWFNKQLNLCQKSAVQRILGHQCRPMPYIIFGPPGTGKTVTLVEAALQVFKCIKSSRLIICAPTNSAADLITVRLHQSGAVNTTDLARLNSFQRNKESIPESILQYCFFGDQDLAKATYHRIIVSTCSNVGILYGLKLNDGHFTHLFLDEAGQATEPECLVAIELVTSVGINGQIILAGDPRQLGPVLTSKHAIFFGLNLSLLERLMSRRLYSRDTEKFSDHGNYDPLLVTKLVQNYRSHPALLKVYSDLFYQSELQATANNLMPVLWDRLNNNFPVLFHGIKGEELYEADSPSVFNPSEVVQTVVYLQELYSLPVPLNSEDIGIITPYRKQVEKIKFMCETLDLAFCKIGSVEEFQGQEKSVILLSTVRCDSEDRQNNHLGFLGQSKRFNVAVSRAKNLLVLIGDPDVLARDENWRSLLKYCIDHNAYVGCDTEVFNSS